MHTYIHKYVRSDMKGASGQLQSVCCCDFVGALYQRCNAMQFEYAAAATTVTMLVILYLLSKQLAGKAS